MQNQAAAALARYSGEQQDMQERLSSAQSRTEDLDRQVATISQELTKCQHLLTAERSRVQELQQQLAGLGDELKGKAGNIER